MARLHLLLAALVIGVLGTGLGVMQARATDPVPTLPAVAAPTPVPAPARTTAKPVTVRPRPVVRFPASLAAGWGIDVSWPQCGARLPAVATGFAIVGVNGGRPMTGNPCLRDQLSALRGHLPVAFYLNLAAPSSGDPAAYGARIVDDGLARIARTGAHVPVVWLDVEILNAWRDRSTNVAVINAALRRLTARGLTGGIYSSVPMWQQVTGGAAIHVPVWLAITGSEVPSLRQACATGLGGTKATMVQYVAITPAQKLVDADVLCRTDAGVLKFFGRL
ncbi:MAG: hypothetical protein QOC82_3287 [Frankiaceae bacterium]|jgi:hypothetical protein|nr:hypothetical protein [Frankiaceae bacterium]MDQ1698619.1 hypothetical protein [Frankiaceae bacterium]